jgi:hypothetical protein
MESQNYDYLKNFGISDDIFTLKSSNLDVYVIRQEKIKKNFSDGAIYKIPGSLSQISEQKSKDDMEIYDDCDQEYSVLGGTQVQEKSKNFSNHAINNFSFLNSHTNKSNFSICNNTEFNLNDKNFIPKNHSNFSTVSNYSLNFSNGKEYDAVNFMNDAHKNLTFLKKENSENNQNNLENDKKCNNNNILNVHFQSSEKLTQTENKNIFKEPHEKSFDVNSKIEEKSQSNSAPDENCLENGIFKDYMQNQMNQLDRIFKEMNESKEAKVIIKAYKSKLKTKFYKIYESNSQFFKEKNKYKIFHKCNFPGCSRTFASAGWLKSHFNEHLQELKLNKFNLEFEKSLAKFKQIHLFR